MGCTRPGRSGCARGWGSLPVQASAGPPRLADGMPCLSALRAPRASGPRGPFLVPAGCRVSQAGWLHPCRPRAVHHEGASLAERAAVALAVHPPRRRTRDALACTAMRVVMPSPRREVSQGEEGSKGGQGEESCGRSFHGGTHAGWIRSPPSGRRPLVGRGASPLIRSGSLCPLCLQKKYKKKKHTLWVKGRHMAHRREVVAHERHMVYPGGRR